MVSGSVVDPLSPVCEGMGPPWIGLIPAYSVRLGSGEYGGQVNRELTWSVHSPCLGRRCTCMLGDKISHHCIVKFYFFLAFHDFIDRTD